LFINYH